MKAKFGGVKEASGFDPIPAGTYRCICVGYEETYKDCVGVINLKWKVLAGAFGNRTFFDSLHLGEKSIGRAKLVCKRLGVKKDLEGEVELEESDFVGVEAHVSVVINEYTDQTGVKKKNNKVTFSGYNETQPGSGGASGPAPSTGTGAIKNPLGDGDAGTGDADAPPW